MRLRWTENALKALISIESYIAQENPAAAKKVFNLLHEQAHALKRLPNIGRKGRRAGTRELILSEIPYIIVYRINDDFIDIITIIHTARRWPLKF